MNDSLLAGCGAESQHISTADSDQPEPGAAEGHQTERR